MQPEYSDTKEAIAQKLLDNFKPTVIDKMLGKVAGKVKVLENLVAESRSKDEKQHQIALKSGFVVAMKEKNQ